MGNILLAKPRKSHLEFNEVYFWTNTIKDWKHLLKQEKYKSIIIQSLANLVHKKLIIVYGFVIMPNHIHLIWEMVAPNGKEKPSSSFNKETAHLIIKDLKENHQAVLSFFKVEETERTHRIWQRDALAVKMYNSNIMHQKLHYIHFNPLQTHWNLAKRPEEYYWSSALFYENGIDNFGFLTHFKKKYG